MKPIPSPRQAQSPPHRGSSRSGGQTAWGPELRLPASLPPSTARPPLPTLPTALTHRVRSRGRYTCKHVRLPQGIPGADRSGQQRVTWAQRFILLFQLGFGGTWSQTLSASVLERPVPGTPELRSLMLAVQLCPASHGHRVPLLTRGLWGQAHQGTKPDCSKSSHLSLCNSHKPCFCFPPGLGNFSISL